MIDTDDVIGLQFVRQAGGQCFYSQRDRYLSGRDIVERHIGRYRYGADFACEDVVSRSQVSGYIQPLHIVQAMGYIGGEVIPAHFHDFGIVAGDLLTLQYRLGDADDLRFTIGLPGDGGESHERNDCRQNQGQNTEDKSVVEFHKHILLS